MSDVVFSGHQPNFAPYLGVFYKMFRSDVFVLDDDVQYSNSGLHNANFLKICGQKSKVTIPVNTVFGDKINEVEICHGRWEAKMLRSIRMNYGKAKFFDDGFDFIQRHFDKQYVFLSDMNIEMIKEIADRFGIKSRIVIASKDVPTDKMNNERNVYQCKALGCNVYYSGVGGKDYNDEKMYNDNGIRIEYSDYVPFEYSQTGRGFIENLSVIDYIMNNGFKIPAEWKKLD
ncbi:MAG TPA: hypothetical protein DHV37_06060 [Erysipelotrichaceae bacterium]|nr:hypothetical protein [Erysipelotrichaceae bacterium]